MKFIRDLFMGVGNQNWDIGRIGGALAVLSMMAAEVWNITLGLPIDLDKFGVGMAAVLGGAAAWIYAKDRAKAENVVAQAVSDATPTAPPAKSAKR